MAGILQIGPYGFSPPSEALSVQTGYRMYVLLHRLFVPRGTDKKYWFNTCSLLTLSLSFNFIRIRNLESIVMIIIKEGHHGSLTYPPRLRTVSNE
jgi:hypothetical protein